MRYTTLIFLFCSFSLCATAQKTKAPVYFYTAASEKYFTDAETDSLLYSISAGLFQENQVPPSLFEKKYPALKSLLAATIKKEVVNGFKEMENRVQKNIAAPGGSPQFTDIKNRYKEVLEIQIRKAYSKTTGLKEYLYFNNSDRITYFNSTVRVGTDGKLLVTEEIKIFNGDGRPNTLYGNDSAVKSAGPGNNEIIRGIVRTFPLYYINKYKLFQNTTFSLKEVLKDGKKEDYHTKKEKNGVVLYIGNQNVILPKGRYTYSITYETDHQLKLLSDYDELYWNVTGNGWSFRIDSARCNILLPKGAAVVSNKCYTGQQGSANEDCVFSAGNSGDSTQIIFKSSKPLLPYQGITIATSWSRGLVKRSGTWQRVRYYIWNNKAVFFLPLAAIFSAIFCFFFWWRYGRDPKKGAVYPQFEPPAGYSPAALGYIYYQKHNRQLTAATIVDAAVRNKIKIDVEREGRIFKHNEYHIKQSGKPGRAPVSRYEEFESEVEDLIDSIIEKGKYNSNLGDLDTAVKTYCEKNYKNKDGGFKKGYRGMFARNTSYTSLPALVCIIAGGWGFFDGLIKALMLKNFWQLAYFAGGWILCTQVLRIFSKLLSAYSPDGRKLMDTIEGFRMFLSTADEKRFDLMNPPKKSLELFEKYLPFAIALGCEIEWGQKFEEIINTAYSGGTAASSFSQNFSRDNESFSSSFTSSFSGAISSASSPPSSSSDGGSSFGGGSSGGGGGGGGGGGW